MPINAPLYGGFSPGADRFAVDGDFSVASPSGMPQISFPLTGDSILSTRDVIRDTSAGGYTYAAIKLGDSLNIQPWTPNQKAMVIEQEFVVAQQYYEPMRLNTRYDTSWAEGWVGQFADGGNIAALNDAVLVREGDLQDIGAGLVKFRRTFATVPPTRNIFEQFAYNFIGLDDGAGGVVPQRVRPRLSRLQLDYFLVDFYNVSALGLFPIGNRLNDTTGMYPAGLLIDEQRYFDADGISEVTLLAATTNPTFAQWRGWSLGSGTSNGLAAEFVCESSVFTNYMGNIWQRRTRFTPTFV